ncbi:MAG: 1-(5-phosphoribosyl)-5-[(5-phosphoribosylamino)methylideneamino]imidazole-4-carboxamide isomerase [Arenicellales bacterium]
MLLIPAIDLIDGQCVRLRQGDYDDKTVFDTDPVAVASKWVDAGARRLHIVDLDGAKAGKPINAHIVQAICEKYPDLPVQIGGGIRDETTVKAYLDAGVSYVIIGTKAVNEPAFIQRLCDQFGGEHIIVGLDAKGDQVATEGWLTVTELGLVDLAKQFEQAGINSIIYTDIGRDGMMQGANAENTHLLAQSVNIPVIAAGGVHKLSDLEQLTATTQCKLAGAITGRAIYEGSLDFAQGQALLDQLCAGTA